MSEGLHAIAFQGMDGANSHMACRVVHPEMTPLACTSFEDAFAAVAEGAAKLAMIPIDNSVAGRVADIHHLLPDSGLHIVGEHFQRVEHTLLAIKGAAEDRLTHVHSHIHALNQCRNMIRELGVEPVVHADTAGAAHDIAAAGDPTQGAIASELAAGIYGLEILRENVEDAEHNTTRFLIMSPDEAIASPDEEAVVTSFVFNVRNVPAALYKALGGFATNNVNMTKLESYMIGGGFSATRFYAEVDGHPDHRGLKFALEELEFFSHEVRILGVFPASPARKELNGD